MRLKVDIIIPNGLGNFREESLFVDDQFRTGDRQLQDKEREIVVVRIFARPGFVMIVEQGHVVPLVTAG